MKLYSTDKNYRIIGIIVHNQKNDMHNVHACLDSKNYFTNYVLVFIYVLLFMILIIRTFIGIIDGIQNVSTLHLLTFINCTVITILFHDYKYSGAVENRYHFSHLTSTGSRDNSLLVVELSDVNYICKLLSTHSSRPCNGFSSFGSARSG